MKKKLQPANLFNDASGRYQKTGNNRFSMSGNWLMNSFKLLSQFVVVIFLISGYALAQVATPPVLGDGSGENPYEIATLENLYWIAEDPARWGFHYVQTADIDASETSGWFEGEGWTPIGTEVDQFRGQYDGGGNAITGLFINRGSEDYQGLFGYIHRSGIVNNLGVTGVNITGRYYTGGLAGKNAGTISYCFSAGNVAGNFSIGGLVGFNHVATITQSYSLVTVSANSRRGGLVGWNHYAAISNSYSLGSNSGSGAEAGGLIGRNSFSTVLNSYSTGSITGSTNVGGLIGMIESSIVTNSFWDTESSGNLTSAAGTGRSSAQMKKIGYFTGWQFPEIWHIDESVNQDNDGYPSLSWQGLGNNPTPMVFALLATDVSNAGFTANWEVSDGADSYLIDISVDEDFSTFITGYENLAVPVGTSLVFTDVEVDVYFYYYRVRGVNATGTGAYSNTITVGTGFADGDGTSGNPYLISDLNQLRLLSENPSIWTSHFRQTIDLSFDLTDFEIGGDFYNDGEGFVPIGNESRPFTGSYNGDSHTISGLFLNRNTTDYQGLFGNIGVNGSLTNIGVVDVNVTGQHNIGALAGKNNGSILNSFATGSVEGFSQIGGLAGWNENGNISNSYSLVAVTGNDIVGGFVGWNNNSSVLTSYSAGSVSGIENVGGFIGVNNDRVENSYWDIEASGQTESAAGKGHTTEEMKKAGTYVGFSFPTIWRIDETAIDPNNNGYPSLAWQGLGHNPTPVVVATRATNTSPTGFTANWNVAVGATGYRLDVSDNELFTTFVDGFENLDVGNVTSYLVSGLDLESDFHYYRVRGINDIGTGANSNTIIVGVVFSGGDGSPDNPYLIDNLDDLKFLSENPYYWDSHFLQTKDLSFSITDFEEVGDFYNEGGGFSPIGNITNYFSGSYDGKGYSISGMFINRVGSDYQAMFGYIGSGAVVRDLGLIDVNITGKNYIGSLAGKSNGTILNSSASGVVSGDFGVGGLVGNNHVGTISQSLSSVNVVGNIWRGGLVGWNHYATISNSYSKGSVAGEGNNAGGLVGRNSFSSIINSYSIGNVSGSLNAGGLVGLNESSTVNNSFWNIETSGKTTSAAGEGKTTEEMKEINTFSVAGWVFPDIWHIDSRSSGAANNGYPSLAWQGLAHGVDLLVTTNAASLIFDVKATLGGNVVNNGSDDITERGILYSQTNLLPTLDGDDVIKVTSENGVGTFSLEALGLIPVTNYYFRAFATTATETGYGTVREFVTKDSQEITFNALEDKTYGDAAFELTATASSGLTVSYLSSDETVATIDGSSVTIVGAGTTTITAIQEGDEFFAPAEEVQQILQIGQPSLTITVESTSKVYGDADPVFTVTYDGFVYNDDESDLTGTLEFIREPGEDTGEYNITASGLTSVNYAIGFIDGVLEITRKDLAITAEDKTKVYGDADPVFTVLFDGFVNGESEADLDGTLVMDRVPGENVGEYTITLSGLTSANYNIEYVDGTLDITMKTLTITAQDKWKNIGQPDPELTVEYDGFIAGEDESDLAGTLVIERMPGEEIGEYAINVSGFTSENYDMVYVPGIFEILAKSLVVTVENKTKVYGEADPAFTVTYEGFDPGDDETVFEGSLVFVREEGEVVGTYTITASGLTSEVYAIEYVNGLLEITRKELTITAENKGKEYGENDPEFTAIYDGFISGEDIDNLDGTLVIEREEGEIVGNYIISASGLTSNNYDVTFVNGVLEITAKELTISGTFTVMDKEQDGTVSAVIDQNNLVLVGVLTGDDVELTNIVVEFTQAEPGDGVTVAIISAELDGDNKDNYTLSLLDAPEATANITTDIHTITVEQIRIYPNPFVDYIYFNYLPESSKITITDITGKRLVVTETNGDKIMNLNYLPRGIFIITIDTPSGEQSTLRLIKQ